MKTKHAPQIFKAASIDRDEHTIRFIMSTPDEDRHGEKIDQRGWDFKNFMTNPVVLWGHDHSIPAIGKVVDLSIVDGNTEGTVKFAYDEHDLAKTIFELCAGGYISAVSVGFRNKRWEMNEDDDTITLLENELYELSIVNIPANARALAKEKGVDLGILDKFEEIERKAVADRVALLGDKKETAVEDPEVPGEEDTVVDEDEVVETDEDKAVNEIADKVEKAQSAIEVLVGMPPSILKRAMKALQDADTKEVVPTPASQGRVFSKNLINRALRSLLTGAK